MTEVDRFCPGEGDALLLKAALASEEDAVEAWKRWTARFELDQANAVSRSLLPLVHENLTALGLDHRIFGKLAGIRRYTWTENQVRLKGLAAVLQSFQEEGVRSLVLLDAAIAQCFYPDLGLRRIPRVDLLLRPQDVGNALRKVRKLGWASVEPWPEALTEAVARARTLHLFRNPAGHVLRLHLAPILGSPSSSADEAFWSAAEPIEIQGSTALTLSPVDQLLHLLAEASKWQAEQPLLWIPDASMILRHDPGLNWERFTDLAAKHRAVLAAAARLRDLHEHYGIMVSAAVLERLRREETTPDEMRRYHFWRSAPEDRSRMDAVRLRLEEYKRWNRERRAKDGAAGFITYLQLYWGLRSWWHVFIRGLAKLANKS